MINIDPLPRVVIRCDGGRDIGMGHVVRCIALAEMLRDNFRIYFVIQETAQHVYDILKTAGFDYVTIPSTKDFHEDLTHLKSKMESADIVVLDGYNFRTEYQVGIKISGNKLVAIDDLHAWHHVADVVINHSGGVIGEDYDTERYSKLLLGFRYVLLRPEFLKINRTKHTLSKVESVFISMGASDEHNLTLNYTKALLEIHGLNRIHLMVSDVNPHFQSLIKFAEEHKRAIILHRNISADELIHVLSICDIAICPASTISLECCDVGIAIITGYTADNQLGILSGLSASGVVINIGNLNVPILELKSKLALLIKDTALLNKLVNVQQELFDGNSGVRIRDEFFELIDF